MATAPVPSKRRGGIPPLYYGLAAGGLAVAYFLYSRSKANSAAAAGSTAANAANATNQAAATNDAVTIAQLQQQLADLQGQTTTTTTGPIDYTAPTGETASGYGLAPSKGTTTVTSPSNVQYSLIANAKARNALTAAGQTVYYQPAPGVFQPYNPATMKGSHTPTYVALTGT